MTKLTMREYTAGFILLTFTLGAALSFTGSIFNQYGTQLQGENKDTVNKLNKEIKEQQPEIANQEDKANSISTEQDTFFLSSILTVIETVTSGVGQIPTIANALISGLNLSPKISLLLSIPVVAVIWEVVSLYRGIRT